MPDSRPSQPDDQQVSPADATIPRRHRRDTLADSDPSDFRHGRFVPGQMLGERYRIVARLGEGGMGEVYRADDLELGQSVALKFLPEKVAADEAWLRRFRNEVRTARQVAHANVCRIYDIGQEDGHVFLSMEYIDGEDLAGVLRRLGRPSREKAIEIARQICLGLAAAHESNVLHRDLKPQNIMIDGRGRVRITDFGLAGFLDELEGTEARAGTPAYMAPEQLAHGKVSVRSDIYSLGLILHELFTGQSVFDTDDVEEIKRRHSTGSVSKPPSTTTDEIDPTVDRVITRCLEPRAEDRPQSVYQVLASLPGGDPLAAALAAGETPSPELVANARDAGGLRPAWAIGLLLFIIALRVPGYFFPPIPSVMPQESPAELSFIASQIMEELGYDDLPRNSVQGMNRNSGVSRFFYPMPEPYREATKVDWPPNYQYWRRWSEGAFRSVDFHLPHQYSIDGELSDDDATATLALDDTGRLLEVTVGFEFPGTPFQTPAQLDWTRVLDLAGLDQADVKEVALIHPPPVFCDQTIAWRLDVTSDPDDAVMIQAGSLEGRLNYFEYVGLDHAMTPPPELSPPGSIAIWFLLVFMAWRNLRADRGDMRNAVRCGLIVGSLYAALEVLSLRLSSPEFAKRLVGLVFGSAGAHILLHVGLIWLVYLAFEPYIRRVWPRMLVGLIRVLNGRVLDPTVGREVLIGVTVGTIVLGVWILSSYVGWRIESDETGVLLPWVSADAMVSPLRFIGSKVGVVAATAGGTATFVGILIVLRLITRHTIASIIIGAIIVGGLAFTRQTAVLQGSVSVAIPCSIAFGAAFMILYTRVGVLSGLVALLAMWSLGASTGELDAWHAPYGLIELGIVLALAVFGFWVSLAGQPIFKDMLAEPEPAGS